MLTADEKRVHPRRRRKRKRKRKASAEQTITLPAGSVIAPGEPIQLPQHPTAANLARLRKTLHLLTTR